MELPSQYTGYIEFLSIPSKKENDSFQFKDFFCDVSHLTCSEILIASTEYLDQILLKVSLRQEKKKEIKQVTFQYAY